VVFNSNGDVVTDGNRFSKNKDYIATYDSGEFTVRINRQSDDLQFATLSIVENPENPNPNNFSSANFTNSDSLKLGQSIISLSGQNRNSVFTGIINELDVDDTGKLNNLKTSVNPINLLNGSVILNLQGEIAGMRIGQNLENAYFVPVNKIREFFMAGDLVFNQQKIAETTTE
jgi:hypothetical protein